MKRNNATNRIRVATKSPSSEAVDIDSPSPEGVERALQCTTDNPSTCTPSAAAIADQPRQEHTRQASAIDGSKVATSTSATDRCCSDSTNNVVDLQNESSPYTKRKIPDAAALSTSTDHLSQAKTSSPSYFGHMHMYLYDDVSDAVDEEERRQRLAAKRRRHEGKITFPSYYEDLLAEVTEELDEANVGKRRRQDGDENRQTLLGLPSFMTTSRNDERHPLAFAAELIAEMDMADMDNDDVDDDDDGDKRIM